MKKTLLILIITIAFASMTKAQNARSHHGREYIENYGSPYSLGVHVGTQGFGINGAYQQSAKVAFRIAASYAPYGLSKTRNWGNEKYNVDMKARFFNAAALVEYSPFNVAHNNWFLRKLTLTGGIAAFFQAKADATATPKENYKYGDIVIPKDEVGSVKAHIKWKAPAPFLGLGLKNIELGGNFFLNVDLGTYYLSSPDVTIVADKMLSENTSNEKTVQENMNSYRWLPVIQTGISIRL